MDIENGMIMMVLMKFDKIFELWTPLISDRAMEMIRKKGCWNNSLKFLVNEIKAAKFY